MTASLPPSRRDAPAPSTWDAVSNRPCRSVLVRARVGCASLRDRARREKVECASSLDSIARRSWPAQVASMPTGEWTHRTAQEIGELVDAAVRDDSLHVMCGRDVAQRIAVDDDDVGEL